MVKILYYRDLNRISVEGHAMSGEAGHDLVCAAVSSLVYTLAAFVKNLKASRQAYNVKTILKEGDAVIQCSPPSRYKDGVTLVYDAIAGGFGMIAEDHPDNVVLEIK